MPGSSRHAAAVVVTLGVLSTAISSLLNNVIASL